MRRSRVAVRFALLAVSLMALGACGGASSASESANEVESTKEAEVAEMSEMVGNRQIIDVRTPEEFADGHVESAVNLNVEDGTLEAALAKLDPAADYVVYCRSGRRSAIAAQLMAERGFAHVTDLGSLEDAAAALGAPVVSG